MKPLSQEWISKAEGDYKVALDEYRTDDPVLDAVCFHAQQCVEKYLKSWLTEQGQEFPRTHDLEDLARRVKSSLPAIATHEDRLILLTSAAVESRYPGLTSAPSDVEQAVKIMREIRTLIRSSLKLADDISDRA